jgi:hypothetical protein
MAKYPIRRLWLGAVAVLLTIVFACLLSGDRSIGVGEAITPRIRLRIAFWTRCIGGLLFVFVVLSSFWQPYPGLSYLHENTMGATGRMIFALLALRFLLDCRKDLKVLSSQASLP